MIQPLQHPGDRPPQVLDPPQCIIFQRLPFEILHQPEISKIDMRLVHQGQINGQKVLSRNITQTPVMAPRPDPHQIII